MLEKSEKIYIIIGVISVIILICITLYFTFYCPKCEVFSPKRDINRPVVVYQI